MIYVLAISAFCLLLMVTLGPALKCYECESSSTDSEPLCDRLYWKQLDSNQWANLSVDCIKSMSTFCIVTWKTLTNGAKSTKRGCMGKTDSQGTRLNAGCIDISEYEKTCLCTDDLCNTSPTVFSSSLHILATTFTVLTGFITS